MQTTKSPVQHEDDLLKTALAKAAKPKPLQHRARSFADQPLNLKGVQDLQNDSRLDRKGAAQNAARASAGTLLPIAVAGTIVSGLTMPALLPVAPLALGCAVSVAAASAARQGIVKPANKQVLRLHGFFYTGIVGSKSQSAAVCQRLQDANILGPDRTLPPAILPALARTALAESKCGLTANQVEKAIQYLMLAADNAADNAAEKR